MKRNARTNVDLELLETFESPMPNGYLRRMTLYEKRNQGPPEITILTVKKKKERKKEQKGLRKRKTKSKRKNVEV